MSNKYIIWCNGLFIPLSEVDKNWFEQSVGKHELHLFETAETGREGASAEILSRAQIAYGAPDSEAILKCENLKWVHLNTAGYTAYDTDVFKAELKRRGTILTNSSAVYDEPCAQHVLAMILSLARGLLPAYNAQRGDKGWRMNELRPTLPLLNEQTVVLLGFGAIARRLVELLNPLGMKLIGVRRHIRGDEPIQMIDESQVTDILPVTDHLINILPASQQTNNYLNDEIFKQLKRGAIVYNIGRGTTLDQTALMENLNSGQLAAAYLDVTNPEPLPPDNLLWTTPNCFITPHTGGGHATEKERQLAHFLNNLKRFEKGKTMLNRIV